MTTGRGIEHPWLGVLFTAALALTGCDGEMLKSDQWTWLWAVGPLIFFAATGLGYVMSARKKQLQTWDLRQPDEPEIAPIRTRFFLGAAGIVVAFAVLNIVYLKNADPTQIALNVGSFMLGTALGAGIAYLLGKQSAERKF